MCRLLRTSLLCLLLLFIVFGNVSFAAPNLSGFTEFSYSGSYYDFANYCFNYIFGMSYEEFGARILVENNQNVVSRWDSFQNDIFNNSYDCLYCTFSRSSNNSNFTGNINQFTIQLSTNSFTSPNTRVSYGFYKLSIQNNLTINYNSYTTALSISSSVNNSTPAKFLFYGGKWYQNNNANINLPTNALKYTSYKTNVININMYGQNVLFNKADYNITDSIKIGYLSNFQYYDDVQGHLSVFSGQSNVDQANYWDQIGSFVYNKNTGYYNNKLSFNKNTGEVTISPNVLQYDHGYALWFDADNNNGTEDYNSTPAVWYFVVPIGSTATSGDINTDNSTGLDFDFINSIEYLTQFSSGNTDYIANSLVPSGDPSGDLLGFTYIDHDEWGFGDFIKTTFNNFLLVLYDYNDISYDMGWLGVHNSSEFITPNNNALITIVSLFSNCFFLMSSIAWFFYTICSIGVLDLDKIVRDKADLGLF